MQYSQDKKGEITLEIFLYDERHNFCDADFRKCKEKSSRCMLAVTLQV